MARLKEVQSLWTSGELDPDLFGQVKLSHYYAGAAKMRNVVVIPQGGFRVRDGLLHLDKHTRQIEQIDLAGIGGVVTAPNGGVVASLTDGDRSTLFTTVTQMAVINPYVIFHVDTLVGPPVAFIDIENWSTSSSDEKEGEFFLQGSIDDVNWDDLGEAINRTTNTEGRDRRRRVDSLYRYYRFVRKGDSLATFPAVGRVGQLRLWQETGELSAVRKVEHNFSTFQRFVMIFTDRNMRVFFERQPVADVPTPYTSADLLTESDLGPITIGHTSLDDTLLVFQESHAPRRYQRQGFNHEWDPKDWVIGNMPTYDFGAGAEPIFSEDRGWPRAGTFFQGRLYMGGSPSRPASAIASMSGNFESFLNDTTDDDKGFVITADADDIAAIFQIYAGRHLQFFTSSSEWYVPISDTQGVTPKNVIMRRTTQVGVKRGIRVYEIDGATVFLNTTGSSIREFIFTDTEAAYQASQLTKLASHLVRNPVSMAYRKALGLDNPDFVWLVNNDGTLASFCTLREEDVNAMTLLETDGKFLDAVVSRTESYFTVERTINGVTDRFLEIFDEGTRLDAAVRGSGVASSVSGLDHLEGETVAIRLDGTVAGEAVVVNGSVDFPRASREKWEVGLYWPFVDEEQTLRAFVESVPIEGQLPDGTQVGTRKRIQMITVRMRNTTGLTVNGYPQSFRQLGDNLLDKSIVPFTGDKVLRGVLGNALQARVTLGISEPAELSVLATSYKVAV